MPGLKLINVNKRGPCNKRSREMLRSDFSNSVFICSSFQKMPYYLAHYSVKLIKDTHLNTPIQTIVLSVILELQSSAIITPFNITWSRSPIRGGTHKNTPYLTLKSELWDVFCDLFGEKWLRYNHTALYPENFIKFRWYIFRNVANRQTSNKQNQRR